MKYAIKSFCTKTQVFKLYDSASRNEFLAEYEDAKPITAKENKKIKTTGTEYTVSKKDYVFFSRIVKI